MEHLAILTTAWGFREKILSGQKRIESRWYKNKYLPWNKIVPGEIIYFKNSGDLVSLKATVTKVLQFSDLTPSLVHELLDSYADQLGIEKKAIPLFFERFQDKRYCIFLFLENPTAIPPFSINKKGYGAMTSWMCVNRIETIKAS